MRAFPAARFTEVSDGHAVATNLSPSCARSVWWGLPARGRRHTRESSRSDATRYPVLAARASENSRIDAWLGMFSTFRRRRDSPTNMYALHSMNIGLAGGSTPPYPASHPRFHPATSDA